MNSGAPLMSAYEAEAWADLTVYWQKKAERRSLPPKVQGALTSAKDRSRKAVAKTTERVSDNTPQAVKDFGGMAFDAALEPTVKAVVSLLDLATELVQELTDPDAVLEFHRERGHDVTHIRDLRSLDLEDLDAFTKSLSLRSRVTGLVQGSAMGALAFVPVAGTVASIGADLVVMHALSTGIATRAAYAYGIDPTTEAEQHHLERMLRKAWAAQAPKTGTVKSAADAFQAGAGRVRWSQRFRNDHRIAAALEKLMKQMGNGKHVPIEKVVTKMPLIGVVTTAGMNQHLLGSLAKTSTRYGRTVHLSQKHSLPLPPNLT